MDTINIKKSLLFIPITLLVVYFCAGIFYNPALVIYIKPFIIPSFIIYVANTNFKKLTLNYFLYVIFFYLNELLILFWDDSVHLSRTALIASFFCYLALVNLGFNSIKTKKLYTVPQGFSLFILAMNCVFLIAILYILMTVISDSYLNIILIFNAVVAVFLGITAVLYFGKFGDKKAYYYFFGAFALIFNDVFAAIGTYFIQDVVLNTFDRILHFTSFYLIYLFIINDRKKVENLSTDSQP
ncbi:hypothetical protein CXF59_02730 [Flavobacterium sp. ALD4]|jgi:hypothetical protein|uniref:hypothetical protein n=1 Tax=Flavobacterium sp. ALD4 TaxID=2058314 RepID=UPI000C3264F4|nr:hypothetical protein [Flavobacterium sp. ALD4]PKH68269.1 hypothetical protein CXF59_02730 [Flavobacterium sp. ALD4]